MTRRIEVVVTRHRLHDPDDDVTYWLSRPVEERIGAVTELRRALFDIDDDDDETRSRLPRIHRVLERS